ncbi:Glutamyl-Q tRNA(Asp) synthetase [Planctomycetes bacterium Pla163]|uniref:Glutamyl-Q tRNA(Asp) synthetase n=1 Tax=Rohdeia mirabilis TaxID=2528008 RepID=A0A518D0P8_9BACT|nr:Glutamyl-Q tRNA(Asp) synthetase [Planctomycetes bacterium Pla163]
MGAPPAGASPTTRLAPSPTGLLHLGHARSFLAAWWVARARGGRVRLRIEDLDRGRSRPEWDDAARADLEWLGLDWDGPVLVQSTDLAPYHSAIDQLLRAGAAFACVCTRRELLEALDAPHATGDEVPYAGTCRDRYQDPAAAERASGRAAGVRFRVPPGPREIVDQIHGSVIANPAAECGDFLVLRRDGAIAYQLAVVVDDARQGVDLVVRGEDLLPSSARQELLQDALGLARPSWCHVPLVLDSEGERLSKRAGSPPLAELRANGVDPRRVVGWAAASLGLVTDERAPDEGLDAAGWIPHLRLDRIARDPVRIDSSSFGPAAEPERGRSDPAGGSDTTWSA